MNCTQVRELLSEWIDGVLTIDTKVALDTHVQHCDSCQQEVAIHQRLEHLLRASIPNVPATDLEARVLAGLRSGSWARRISRHLTASGTIPAGFKLRGALVAGLVLLLFTGISLNEVTPERASNEQGLERLGGELNLSSHTDHQPMASHFMDKLPAGVVDVSGRLTVSKAISSEQLVGALTDALSHIEFASNPIVFDVPLSKYRVVEARLEKLGLWQPEPTASAALASLLLHPRVDVVRVTVQIKEEGEGLSGTASGGSEGAWTGSFSTSPSRE